MPLVAVTVTVKNPVGVPVTRSKFTEADVPPPGAEFVTTTGKVPVLERSLLVKRIEISDELVNVIGCATPL